MQSRHGQFLGFNYFICILKASMQLAFFNLSGKTFRNEESGMRYFPTHDMYCSYWRYGELEVVQKVVKIQKDRSFFILYISVARIWRSRLWIETEPSFSNSVSNNDCLSECIICKQGSCSLFILLLLARLWHIYTRGQ